MGNGSITVSVQPISVARACYKAERLQAAGVIHST